MIRKYLMVFDFDRTIGDTFVPSPNNIDVNQAYEDAIVSIFGDRGLEIYKEIGGLKNRAPIELVIALLEKADNNKGGLIKRAKVFFEEHGKILKSYMPESKKIALEWDEENPIKTITEILVRVKLSRLLGEIGPDWPKPCSGFLDFFKTVEKINSEGMVNIQMAILSSGHDMFIKKTFECWGIKCPAMMVTDDDLREMDYPRNPKDRVKPSITLFNLIHSKWLIKQTTISGYLELTDLIFKTRCRIIYFGDDPNKDGLLARKAGVPFGLFAPDKKEEAKASWFKNEFSFNNWEHVSDFLKRRRIQEAFNLGKTFSEIASLF